MSEEASESSSPSSGGEEEVGLVSLVRNELVCIVCVELFVDPIALSCGHALCRRCLRRIIVGAHPRKARCPSCRVRVEEDEEAPVCIPLRNCARFFVSPSPEREEDEEDENEVGELLTPPSLYPPPQGWQRIPGMRDGVVFGTRMIRRDLPSKEEEEENNTTALCLGLRFETSTRRVLNAQEVSRILFSTSEVYVERLVVAVMRMEDDEIEDGGFPWLLQHEDDDCLVARDQEHRTILLDANSHDTADLVQGHCIFHDVFLSQPVGDDGFATFAVVDAQAALECRIAFRRFLPEEDDDDDTNSEEEEEEEEDLDEYDENDGFLVPDDDDDDDDDDADHDDAVDDGSTGPAAKRRRRLVEEDEESDS